MEFYDFTVITSTDDDWKTSVVQIGHDDDIPFIAWMTACEYLIHTVAKMSNRPYDEAVKLLKDGSGHYTDQKPA